MTRSLERHRKSILLPASGKILEIGFGSGMSLSCYPDSVTEIIGLEPNQGMLRKTEGKLGSRAKVVKAVGENIPFDDKEFDCISSFMTLCSVSDLPRVVSEMKRVLKANGKIYFIEHMAHPKGTLTRSLQQLIQPVWGHLACGCHIDRDILHEFQRQDFKIENLKTIGYSGFPNFLSPLNRGVAVL